MAAAHILQATWSRGELTPRLHARADIQDYQQALAVCRNWIVMRHGGIVRRPGFIWIGPVRDSTALARLFEFEFNVQQAYALLFNGGYIRFYTLGGQVRQASQAITGISKASPAVVTYSGADTYVAGEHVWISGIVGMTEVNDREFTVGTVNTGANTFELSGVDSTGYTTWSSGGTVEEIYEVAHPYADADLFKIQITQSGDTVYIACEGYAPRKLIRSSETSWAISVIAFDDGPYLDEDTQGTVMTPAQTGAVHPKMTSLTAPSGTVADDDTDADAWEVFDQNTATTVSGTNKTGWLSYDFAAAATKVCDAYWIRAADDIGASDDNPPPAAWKFQGYDGANWVTLDSRQDETTWGSGETRFYEFANTGAYQSYRILWSGAEILRTGTAPVTIAEMGWHEAGDSQTAFNLTASAVTGINTGAGFQTTDVGRTIRLLGSDNRWRWAVIVARTSTTIVTIRLYGHALPDTGIISHWQMSAWNTYSGYPKAVGFMDDRLGWGGSDGEPLKVWLSRSSAYEDHGASDPVNETDGINIQMTGGQLNRISFMEELGPLVVGTPGTMRIVSPLDTGQALASTNVQQKPQGAEGAAEYMQPCLTGSTLLFVDRYETRIYEFAFDFNANSFVPRELSIESEHLFRAGVMECAWQAKPNNLLWFIMANGRATVLTYEQTQRVVGFVDVRVAGGGTDDGEIMSVASIPSAGGDVTYAVISRTIGGATVQSVEYVAPFYDTDDALADAVYFDSAGTATGTNLTGVAGLYYLRGESVGVLADGVDIGDVTISATGVLTLPTDPGTADTITWGKRYRSYAETLRVPNAGAQDGSSLGRPMTVLSVRVDMLNAKGLEAGSLVRTDPVPRVNDPRAAAAGALNTGMFDVPMDDRHDNAGVVVLETEAGYPATLRALLVEVEAASVD